jgi:hypothetical protein
VCARARVCVGGGEAGLRLPFESRTVTPPRYKRFTHFFPRPPKTSNKKVQLATAAPARDREGKGEAATFNPTMTMSTTLSNPGGPTTPTTPKPFAFTFSPDQANLTQEVESLLKVGGRPCVCVCCRGRVGTSKSRRQKPAAP